MAHAGGRPSSYSRQLGLKICREVSTTTESLEEICKRCPEFPTPKCIYEWRLDHAEFGDMYAKAKQNQADLLVNEIKSISDDTSNDTIINKQGEEVCNSEWIARSRLKVDTRKWIACKLLPKVYGERVIQDTNITFTQEDWLKGMKD
jgi:hypothetical protein